MVNLTRDPQAAVGKMKKRRNLYTIIFVCILLAGGFCGAIPYAGAVISGIALVVWGIFAGCGMFCINNIRYIESDGRKKGGGLWWLLLLVFGIIVIPILTVFILSKIDALAKLVLGVDL